MSTPPLVPGEQPDEGLDQRPGGRRGGRTRPARRRPPPPRPPDLARLRRRLGRATLLLAALTALLSLGSGALLRARRGEAPAPATATAPAPAGAVTVSVTRIIDGDTLDVRAAETALRIRLYGVDAPEAGTRCAAEATQRLTELAGASVSLLSDARLTDRYGRELRYVYSAGGQSIDAALVREGLARAWREDGAQREAIIALEEQAHAARRGCLWVDG